MTEIDASTNRFKDKSSKITIGLANTIPGISGAITPLISGWLLLTVGEYEQAHPCKGGDPTAHTSRH